MTELPVVSASSILSLNVTFNVIVPDKLDQLAEACPLPPFVSQRSHTPRYVTFRFPAEAPLAV